MLSVPIAGQPEHGAFTSSSYMLRNMHFLQVWRQPASDLHRRSWWLCRKTLGKLTPQDISHLAFMCLLCMHHVMDVTYVPQVPGISRIHMLNAGLMSSDHHMTTARLCLCACGLAALTAGLQEMSVCHAMQICVQGHLAAASGPSPLKATQQACSNIHPGPGHLTKPGQLPEPLGY